MRRREFITLLGGAAAAWPLAARAQQAGKLPTIGVLGSDAAAWQPWTAALVERLRQLGWIDGRTIAIEYRWSQARPERAAEIAAEFVHLKVDIVVTAGPHVATPMQATAVIPIVFALAQTQWAAAWSQVWRDRAATSLDCRTRRTDLAGKRLELLREALPRLRRLAIIGNAGYPEAVREMREAQAAARTLSLEVAPLEIRRAEDIATAFATLDAQADALYRRERRRR